MNKCDAIRRLCEAFSKRFDKFPCICAAAFIGDQDSAASFEHDYLTLSDVARLLQVCEEIESPDRYREDAATIEGS